MCDHVPHVNKAEALLGIIKGHSYCGCVLFKLLLYIPKSVDVLLSGRGNEDDFVGLCILKYPQSSLTF